MKKKHGDRSLAKENLGIILGFIACIIFWFPYEYIEKFLFFPVKRQLNLKPDLITGIISLVIIFILYVRKIIYCGKKSKLYISLCVNITLIATIVQIFLNPTNIDKIHRSDLWLIACAATIAAVLAIMIFGVIEFAKIAVLIGILFLCLSNLSIVNEAMGFMGFVNVLVIFSSYYFQQNINFSGLKADFNYVTKREGCYLDSNNAVKS